MKKTTNTLLLASLLALSPLGHASRTESSIQIMQTGFYHGDEIASAFGVNHAWLALEVGSQRANLRRISPKINQVLDAIVDFDSPKSAFTGKEVTLSKEGAILLIKSAIFKPGTIRMASVIRDQAFKFNGARYTLLHQCSDQTDANQLTDCEVTLSNGKQSQWLASTKEARGVADSESAVTVKVIWAGDLDRDGKVDLILSKNFENGESKQLLLSSKAKQKEFVKLVAEVTRTGC